jgi:excisionase family DNA binding protein
MNDILFTPIRLKELELLIQNSVEKAMRTVQQLKADNQDELLTVDGAARLLDCTKPTIYQKTSAGELPFMKKGKRLFFLKSDLIEYMKTGRNKTVEEIAANPENYLRQQKGRA